MSTVVLLLQAALSLPILVQSNPFLPQSVRDNAVQVAQGAITQANLQISSGLPSGATIRAVASSTITQTNDIGAAASSTGSRQPPQKTYTTVTFFPSPTSGSAPLTATVAAKDCTALAPVTDPATNRASIVDCLKTEGSAVLAAGLFAVDRGITMPSNTSLTSSSHATIQSAGTSENFLVSTADNDTLSGITLDGNGNIAAVNGSVIEILGSNSKLSKLWIGSKKAVSCASEHIAGIYFITPTSNGNTLSNSEITGICLGAIFGKSDSSHVNTIDTTTLHDNACNNITFIGYGVLRNSDLSHSGWDCNNGISGGSIYSLNNSQGGLIENNKIHDDCGNLIDLDTVQHFTISHNQILNPGFQYTRHDTFPVCAGSGIAIVDSSYNTIQNNEVQNNGTKNLIKNILYAGDDHMIFSPDGPFSDLPKAGNTIMAFWLGNEKSQTGTSVGNIVKNNGFRAACTGNCAAVGYYIGRGTGTTAGDHWSAQTTNYFTGNASNGSNIGSKRCGANWYAANSNCTSSPTDPSCNNDDFQHSGDWSRNDMCRYWDQN